MSSTTLQKLLDQWPSWPVKQAPKLLRVFSAGLNHQTALIETSRRKLVIKQFSAPAKAKEVAVQRWAATLGLAPKLLYYSREHSYSVMEYAGPESLADQLRQAASPATAINDAQLVQLSLCLKTLHAADWQNDATGSELARLVGHFDILKWCAVYLPNAGQKANTLHHKLQPILQSYINDNTRHCLCHNDLVAANCFADRDAAQFIDWEYAQLHNPWFDLAALMYYLKLDGRQCQLLMRHYNERWLTQLNSDIYLSSQCALLWGDMLWHLNRFGESYWEKLELKRRDLFVLCDALGIRL